MTQENVDAWRRIQQEFSDHVPVTQAEKVFHRNAVSFFNRKDDVTISVVKMDTMDAASALFEGHEDPLVLVLADAVRPGGCVGAGAGMQEESLFRRTALFKHLERAMYPIEPLAAIYAPDVPVSSSYRMKNARTTMSFVACPGVKMPPIGPDGRMLDDDALLTRRKIELIFQIARDNGHDSLVLGALGCGAFGCPPRHVAEIFRDVLRSDSCSHSFSRVVFAVLGANCGFFDEILDE